MSRLLDFAAVVFGVAYLAFFASAIVKERRGTLKDLIGACQAYWTAVALAVCALVVNVASIPYDGWLRAATSVVTLACAIGCAVLTERVRDRKVLDEMRGDL